MKAKFLILFAIIFISNVYGDCSSYTPLGFQSTCNVENIYNGVIGNSEIQMKFMIDEHYHLSGSYYYIKHKIPIPIKGRLNPKGQFTIKEYGEPGRLTGVFEAKFLYMGVMEGEWSNPEGDKSYPFRVECKKVFELCRDASNGNVGFKIIREYRKEGLSVVKIRVDDKVEIALAEEEDYGCISIMSIEVQKLIGKPNLFYVKWLTNSEGKGDYILVYYLLFTENDNKILIKRHVSQVRESGCDYGRCEYSLKYQGSTVLLIKHYKYRNCSGMNKDGDYDQIAEGEETVYLNYKIMKKNVELVKAEKYERSVNGNQKNFDDLSGLLEKEKWNKSKIPIELAKRQYPAIDNKSD